jgi:hypothetical protein
MNVQGRFRKRCIRNATIVMVPSTAVESMQLRGLAEVTALAATLRHYRPPSPGPGCAPAKPRSDLRGASDTYRHRD